MSGSLRSFVYYKPCLGSVHVFCISASTMMRFNDVRKQEANDYY